MERATGGVDIRANAIEVAGFNSFIASRWLYTFEATEEDVVSIASSLKLEPSDEINLKESLGRDMFFSERAYPMKPNVPGKNVSLAYGRTEKCGQAVGWTTLVYSASSSRAWMYTGFQN
jgi:hypothetical protein